MSVKRIFAGPERVYVPDLGLWVDPGDEVTFESAPADSPVWLTPAKADRTQIPPRKPRGTVHDPEPDAAPADNGSAASEES